MYSCAICGKETSGDEHWLLLIDNRWQDRLKVLQWEDRLASLTGVQAVCCTEHGRELIVHWMTTGSLTYPFAEPTPLPRAHRIQRPMAFERVVDTRDDIDCDESRTIGELAIHRDSLRRVLNDNPEALRGILESLLQAVEARVAGRVNRRVYESDYCLAPTVM
jgi:hypothetical protein